MIPIEVPDVDAQIVSVIANLEFYRAKAVSEVVELRAKLDDTQLAQFVLAELREILETNMDISPGGTSNETLRFVLDRMDALEAQYKAANKREGSEGNG